MNYSKEVILNIGGKKRTAKLGLGFLDRFQRSENVDIQEEFSAMQEGKKTGLDKTIFFVKLIFHSLAFACERVNEKVDFDFHDVLEWCEAENFEGAFAEFIEAYTNSMQKAKPSSNDVIPAANGGSRGKRKPQ